MKNLFALFLIISCSFQTFSRAKKGSFEQKLNVILDTSILDFNRIEPNDEPNTIRILNIKYLSKSQFEISISCMKNLHEFQEYEHYEYYVSYKNIKYICIFNDIIRNRLIKIDDNQKKEIMNRLRSGDYLVNYRRILIIYKKRGKSEMWEKHLL